MANVQEKAIWSFVIAISIIFAFILCVFFLPNDFVNPLESYQSTDSTFSVLTFNLDAGDTLRFTKEKQDKFIKFINKYKPSILCLQELSFDNHLLIRSRLDSIYGNCDTLLTYADNKWRYLFYSRYPIRNFKRYKGIGIVDTSGFDDKLKAYSNTIRQQLPMMSAEFEVKSGYWLTVFSGHLRSSAYSTARRSMRKDQSWFEGVSLYNKNYNEGKRIRNYEAKSIRKYVEDNLITNKPVIVAGDLNDWNGSYCLNILQGIDDIELMDVWSEGGSGVGFTYFGRNLRLRLDHILYSKGLELQRVNVLNTDISDHRPLVAVFSLK